MPKKAHSEEQIVAVLRQGEGGEKVADICRKGRDQRGNLLLHTVRNGYLGSPMASSGNGQGLQG